ALEEVDAADVVVFDLAPRAVAEIAGDRLPARVARAYRRYRHGPGAFKLDLAVEGGVPWMNDACRRAGTVHAAGSFEEIALAERPIWWRTTPTTSAATSSRAPTRRSRSSSGRGSRSIRTAPERLGYTSARQRPRRGQGRTE